MKKIKITLALLMTVLALSICATFVFAAPQTVYVSAKGNDANDGSSAAKAVATLDRAFELMPDGGKIVFTGSSYTIDKNYATPKSEGKYTLTSQMVGSDGKAGVVNYSGLFELNADFLIEDIRFKGTSTPIIVCNGNNVTFGNNIKNDSDSYIVGGVNLTSTDGPEKGNLTEDYTIEIKSGRWQYFYGGNRRATGSAPTSLISADINIIVDGATFKNTDMARDGKTNCISGMNSISGNVNFTMKSGEIYGCLYAVGRVGKGGSPTYNGNITVRLLGGTFKNTLNDKGNGIFDVCQETASKLNGDFHLEISNAAVVEFTSIGSTGVVGAATLDVPSKLIPRCEGFIREVYVSSKGKDTNSGAAKAEAYATLERAFEAVSSNGGKIIVCDDVEVKEDTVLKASNKEVVITSVHNNENYKASATLKISAALSISSKVTFTDITLGGKGTLYANGNQLTLEETVAADGNLNVSASGASGDSSLGGQAVLLGGNYNIVSAGSVDGKGAASASGTLVSIEGATVKILAASGGNDISGSAVASILKGEITDGVYGIYGTGAANVTGTAVIEIAGGKIGGKIAAISDGITGTAEGKFELSLIGGDISGVSKISGAGFATSVGKSTDDYLSRLEGFSATVKETVVFVKLEGAGNKDGSAPEHAVSSIDDAIKLLGEGDGTIVICGPAGVDEYTEPVHKGNIKITSRYAGVDYRRVADAKLYLRNKYIASGPVTFDDITVVTDGGNRFFFGNGYPIVFGEGVSCVIETSNKNNDSYPYIFGGSNNKADVLNGASVTVNGGTWNRVVGGNRYSGTSILGDISVVINGGNLKGYVVGSGFGTVSGNITVEINGGTVRHGVFGIYCESTDNTTVDGAIDIYLNGGKVIGKVNASRSDLNCSFSGVYTLYINKTNLDSVTDIKGAGDIRGKSESKRVYGEGVNYADAPEGTVTVNNPLCTGADPWVIYHEGFYYMAIVRGSAVYVSKAATVADLGDAEPVPVWKANEENGLTSIWSPELHYFSADEFGEEYEGWYLYIACTPYGSSEDNQINTRRCYVTRSVTSDPQGDYMAPDTKKLNGATLMNLYDDNTRWAIGPSIFRIDGKAYLSWTGTVKNPDRTYQTLNLGLMTSPYEIDFAKSGVFCEPTEEWEKHGATYGNEKNSPEVVEGATALYGPDGSVYCVYSVSGYWTPYYSLATLKYKGGDPLNMANWEKSSAPVFVANKIDVFGPGHAAFVQSADGATNYFVYHGYKTSAMDVRYVHVEEYVFDEEGNLKFGNGVAVTGDVPVVVTKNPLPLSARMSAFGKSSSQKPNQGTTTPDTDISTDTDAVTDTVNDNEGGSLGLVIGIISGAVVIAGGAAAVVLSKKKGKKTE